MQFAPGLWRTDLQRQDLSIPGREVIQSRVDIDPEAAAVKHTHPGEEIIYVLKGSLEYQVAGQPTRTFHTGGALTVPAGAVTRRKRTWPTFGGGSRRGGRPSCARRSASCADGNARNTIPQVRRAA